ncbi:MAG: oligosaccharide flippase family protein [Candidatus Lokiarchaeota archaeon]|nr:oligosaccharide flippase family protein [Candidatus Lokiarchaeota archaeon]
MKLIKNVFFKNVSVILISKVLSKIILALVFAIIVRHITKAEFGQISIIISAITIATSSILNGINYYAIKNISASISEEIKIKELFSESFFITLFTVLIIGALLVVFNFLLPNAIISIGLFGFITIVIIGVFTNSLMNLIIAFYQGIHKFNLVASISILKSLITISIVSILLFFDKLDFDSVIIVLIITPLLPFFYFIIFDKKYFNLKFIKNLQFFKKIDEYKWYVSYTFLQVVGCEISVFMLNTLRNLEEVAVFNVAYKVYGVFFIALYSLHTVLLPKFSSINNEKEIIEKYFNLVKRIIPFSLGIIFITTIGANFIIYLFAGGSYEESITPLIILGISSGISLIFSPSINVLFALNDIKTIFNGSVLLILVLILSHLTFTNFWGAIGASITVLVSFSAQNIYMHLRIWIKYKKKL